MTSSRRSRSLSLDPLESRVVLSQFGAIYPNLMAAEVSAQAASSGFPLSEKLSLKLGISVEDAITTKFSDGSTQTETRLIVPNLANNTVTTTATINLRNNGGVQQVTDVASTKGNVTTQAVTTTGPGASTSVEAVTDIRVGDQTLFWATVNPQSGGQVRISGTVTQDGPSSTTDETTVQPDGTTSHSHIVDVTHGTVMQSTRTKTTEPGGPEHHDDDGLDLRPAPAAVFLITGASPMRWVGIDEAGYGPNLGPLVMTAVVVEGLDGHAPDLWRDLASTVSRAGSRDGRLWVDDSKAVYRGGKGLDRLEAATLAALDAARGSTPNTFVELLEILGVGGLEEAELDLWATADVSAHAAFSSKSSATPFAGATWRIVDVKSVVVGPARFNGDLAKHGLKSGVHFAAFCRLLRPLWDEPGSTFVRSDKHGGRHFYAAPLSLAFPEAEIVRGDEGPARSGYHLLGEGRRLELELIPKADSVDGLVALASMVSKLVRERWMAAFNAYWAAIVPDLAPTAGYPVDAARFRAVIEPLCLARGLTADLWWRSR